MVAPSRDSLQQIVRKVIHDKTETSSYTRCDLSSTSSVRWRRAVRETDGMGGVFSALSGMTAVDGFDKKLPDRKHKRILPCLLLPT